MKLTKSQKLFIEAGRILEALRHDIKSSKRSALVKLIYAESINFAKKALRDKIEEALAEHRKEQQ